MKYKIILSIIGLHLINTVNAQQIKKDSINKLKEVFINSNYIFGSKFEARNKTGSAIYISPEDLKKFNYTDINRVLKTVAGVNVYEEDGFGLRPNISLRGTSAERSSKITLMEDGVLIAPAPYSAPAAYYFPSIARMNAVEILKGSSQIEYGPFTTGGAINFISTPIPNQFSAAAEATYGSFNSSRFKMQTGANSANIGFVVQYLNFNSDGFKDLPNGANTGFDKNDFVAKLRLNTNIKKSLINILDLKIQYSDEISNETYLGLSDSDFNKNPFSRYAGSAKDKMTNNHHQISATHSLIFKSNLKLCTTVYRNTFFRNWYKLNDVSFGLSKKSISSIVENPTLYNDHFSIINGSSNSANNALWVKANNRNYLSKGVQSKLNYRFYTNQVQHDVEAGIRFHYDEEDRFQWVDGYNILGGIMNLTSEGVKGADANRISSAKALAIHALYKLKFQNITFSPGFRIESIDLLQKDYGKLDPTRIGTTMTKKDNHTKVWLPGLGINYNFKQNISFFGGIHKGFAPPTNQPDQKAESSTNIEMGSRYKFKKISGEIIGFFNNYSNLLGSDLAASGGIGTLDQFNAGKVEIKGIELIVNTNLLNENSKFAIPAFLSYTFTDTKFLSSFTSPDELWGVVKSGDELPYISKHQLGAGIGLEHNKFDLNLSAKFNGEFRTKAGSGAIPENLKVANNFIIDFGSKYNFNKNISAIANINNILNTTYAVARVPSGLRPGMPFSASIGIVAQF